MLSPKLRANSSLEKKFHLVQSNLYYSIPSDPENQQKRSERVSECNDPENKKISACQVKEGCSK